MTELTKDRVVKAASFIAVTFALGLGTRYALKAVWKVSKAIDRSVGLDS